MSRDETTLSTNFDMNVKLETGLLCIAEYNRLRFSGRHMTDAGS